MTIKNLYFIILVFSMTGKPLCGNNYQDAICVPLPENNEVSNVVYLSPEIIDQNNYNFYNKIWTLNPTTNSEFVILNYSGIVGIQDERNLEVFIRSDSIGSWQKFDQYFIVQYEDSPFDGRGSIKLQTPVVSTAPLLALAEKNQPQHINQPIGIQAQMTYGPIHIIWDTQSEDENKLFAIERKVEDGVWDEIGQQSGLSMSVFPVNYRFEDVSCFPEGTTLYYRIKQINQTGQIFYSQSLKMIYSPRLQISAFHFALLDTTAYVINLAFQTVLSGKIKIRLYDRNGSSSLSLVEKTIDTGYYSILVDLEQKELSRKFLRGFCRLEIFTIDKKQTFIQIKPVQILGMD